LAIVSGRTGISSIAALCGAIASNTVIADAVLETRT
jgi:hypothetical protein